MLTCFDICCFICVGRQNGPKMAGFGKNEFSDIKLWFTDTQKAYWFAESCYFCILSKNRWARVETTCTTSPEQLEQIEVMRSEG